MGRYLDRLKKADQCDALGGASVRDRQMANHQNLQNPALEGFDGFVGRSDGSRAGIRPAASETPAGPAPRIASWASCTSCRHCKRPGRSSTYCSGGRDDLPGAYGLHHPLRKLPDDRGATCASYLLSE